MIVTCIGVDVFQIMKLYGFKLVDTNWLFEWYMIMTDYTHTNWDLILMKFLGRKQLCQTCPYQFITNSTISLISSV